MKFNIFHILIGIFIIQTTIAFSQNEKRKVPVDDTSYKNHVNKSWADNSIWDDGLAEVAVYEASQKIYGEQKNFECTYVTVKEVFNDDYKVKTDDYSREDLYDVIKVNRFERIETANYPYHFLSSMFFKRNEPQKIHKMTISSQDWCGNTYKAYTPIENGYQIDYNSYWDGEGVGTKSKEGVFLFEDQLPFTLRTMNLSDGLKFNARFMPTQISSKLGPVYADLAMFRVGSTNYTVKQLHY